MAAVLAAAALTAWRSAIHHNRQVAFEPFPIAGNLYYVGTPDVTAFLLTGPQGHVLIDGGYPESAAGIMANIARLGFRITDVKVLLNTHAHEDHAGGLAALQKASGAQLWISRGDARVVAAGGVGDPTLGPFRLLAYLGLTGYPAPRIDHRFDDGATVRLGPIELTAHATPGHTPGCTSWSFPVRDGARRWLAVDVCSLTVLPFDYPGRQAGFERSFRTLRSLPAELFLGSHASFFGMQRKLAQRAKATDPVAPFIDRAGYLRYVDRAEATFRRDVAKRGDR
ncbi:subclass B3 metallo-beta-lactamase [Fulvimonas yonginensis]